MRKKIALILALTICTFSGICGCGEVHEHVWNEATCTEPRTCAECGAVEGETLGHDWIDATCMEPKVCARCGVTEGNALGHDWSEATCTEPETCLRCGETVGEALGHDPTEADLWTPSICKVCGEEVSGPLTPYFVEQGYRSSLMTIKTEYGFTAWYYTNYLDGRIKVVAYDIFPGGEWYWDEEEEPIELAEKEGYEWRIMNASMKFRDPIHHGVFTLDVMDYYLGEKDDDTNNYPIVEDNVDHGHLNFHVITQFRDEEIEYDTMEDFIEGDLNSLGIEKEWHLIFAACVPIGYDGAVVMLAPVDIDNSGTEIRNYLYFRLANLDE